MKNLLLLFLFFIHFQLQAQYKNVVFEGGGIRGIAYSGVVDELEKNNILQQIQRVGGTSAGAITALCIALGYNSSELAIINEKTPYQKFNDGKFIFLGGMHRTNKYYGWYRGNYFLKWIGQIIKEKTGNENTTFKELHENGKFKDLYITATSLTFQQSVFFSYEHTPNVKLKDAVRISMSIPLYFEAGFRNSKGEIIFHPKKKEKENLEVLVDGGILSNYPIQLFDSTKYVNNTTKNVFAFNNETIGVLLESNNQFKQDSTSFNLVKKPINSFKNYLWAFYTMVLENLNRSQTKQEDWARTIIVNSTDMSPKIKKMSLAEKNKLIANGRNAVIDFLKKK